VNVTETKQSEDRPVEDRLRAAVRAYVPDHSTPPLRLPARSARPVRRPGWGASGPGWRSQRIRGWAVPLAAAVAVVAVVAASLAITRGVNGRGPGHPAAAAQVAGVPPYYVSIWTSGRSKLGHVEVRATSTGAVQATVSLPRTDDYNPGMLAIAANDRVFILDGRQQSGHQRAFLLRFTPAGRGQATTQLTPLSIPVSPTTSIPFALSPDGTLLASVTYTRAHSGYLTVYNLVTGTQRTWTGWGRPLSSSFGSLAWSADGRWLQYAWWPTTAHRAYFGRLDTSAPGTTVPAPTTSTAVPFSVQMTLLADGHLSVLTFSKNTSSVDIVSPRGGAPVVIPIWGPGGPPVKHIQDPVWSSDTGETMILSTGIPPLAAGVWRGGHYHPLPLARVLQQAGNPLQGAILSW
jgi:hypothetical protein